MHVRDEIPDVQQRRPEVSAALAAVVERATAKQLARRYARARELIADLEEALAIETARTGSADGREATVVLRTLPRRASDRVPLRAAPPGALLAAVAVLAIAAVAAVVVLALAHTHHGTAPPPDLPGSTTQVNVDLSQNAASPVQPVRHLPRGPLHGRARDRRRRRDTAWATSTYLDGRARQVGRRLLRRREARASQPTAPCSTRPTPGFDVQIWGADTIEPWGLHAASRAPGSARRRSAGRCWAARAALAAQHDDRARARRSGAATTCCGSPSLGADPARPPRTCRSRELDASSAAAPRRSGAVAALARVALERELAELARPARVGEPVRPPTASRRRSSA